MKNDTKEKTLEVIRQEELQFSSDNGAPKETDYISFYQQHIEKIKQVTQIEWQGHCPFPERHSDGIDSKPSFYVNSKTGQYYCQACMARGNLIIFCKNKGIPIPDKLKRSGIKKKWQDPIAIFDYTDENGTLFYQACRFPDIILPDSKTQKIFKQRRPDGKGGWIYQVKGIRKVLYRLPDLLKADPDFWVFIPEGEKHCDRLYSLGLVATCNVGGAEKWTKALNLYLKDRRVCILPDNDLPGQRHGQKVAQNLYPVAKEVRVVNLPGLKHKGDIVNWLDDGHTKEELLKLLEQAKVWNPGESVAGGEVDGEGKEERQTQAQLLIAIAQESELFCNFDNQVFATISIKGHKETWPVRSSEFGRWLRNRFFALKNKPPGGQAFSDALYQIEAKAQFIDRRYNLFTRLAEHKGKIYLDLVNPEWRVVEITPDGWRIINDSPVKFRRNRGMLPLPNPVKGGSLNDLRQFVNIPDNNDWILFCAWLVGATSPKGPYTILVIHGEQGSAKSFTCKTSRSILDPSIAPLRAIPQEERDLVIAANNSWIVAFDNVSYLSEWLSDALCRVSTGGGLSKRQNYSDDQEVLFNVVRPIMLNDIDSIVQRHDLADRSIIINLPPILEEKRKPENEIQKEFEKVLPGILGALCDAASEALKNLANTKLPQLPRMADFALWVTAAETVAPWGKGEFLKAYTGNRKEVIEISLEADNVSTALRIFLEKEVENEWEGTATELLNKLKDYISDQIAKGKDWPQKPNSLSSKLKRAATNLRVLGIEIIQGQRDNVGKKIITIRKRGEKIDKIDKIDKNVTTY